MSKSCFGCIHQNIMETSHEWIECKCRLDGQWHNPFSGCDKCEEPAPIEVDDLGKLVNEW